MSFFAAWLDGLGYDRESARLISPLDFLPLVTTYIHEARQGRTPSGQATVSAQTLRHYILSASQVLTILTGHPCDLSNAAARHCAKPGFHIALEDQLQQTAAWQQPRDRYDPITLPMLEALGALATQVASSRGCDPFLLAEACVLDAVVLGLFTGSRVSEYAQTDLLKGQLFHAVPATPAAGCWAGTPLAFMVADFQFFTQAHTLVSIDSSSPTAVPLNVTVVRIRFRYDKSPRNFTERSFRRTTHPWLCPVTAAARLVRRANLFRLPATSPVAVHLPLVASQPSLGYVFLRSSTVQTRLRQACQRAYPDPAHYFRRNIHRISCHSVRVTAALLLRAAGHDVDSVAFRLRWLRDSVPTYLRDLFNMTDPALVTAVREAAVAD